LQLALRILDLRLFEESHRAAIPNDELGGEDSAQILWSGQLFTYIVDCNSSFQSSSITQKPEDMFFVIMWKKETFLDHEVHWPFVNFILLWGESSFCSWRYNFEFTDTNDKLDLKMQQTKENLDSNIAPAQTIQ
jgi:hypothetical protein